MKILLMAQHYAPEEVSGAVLATDLAADLSDEGHFVTFLTAAPSYPLGKVFPGYRNRLYQVENREGPRVVRTWSYITPRKTFWRRILNYSTFSFNCLWAGWLTGKPDVMLAYSPPLPLGLAAWMLSRLWRVPWVLRVEDLYPDAAVNVGLLRNSTLIALISRLEKFLYRRADHISLISESFRENLLSKGSPSEKLSVVPVWADPEEVVPLPKENAFRAKHALEGQFIVMYAGNLGETSALDEVIEAASLLRSIPDLRFVIIGDGVKKAGLVGMVREKGLQNVLFLPFQPREELPQVLAAADISLVTLNEKSSTTSFPCKTFNIMASARPILSVAPPESNLAKTIVEAGCGVVVPPGQPETLANAIKNLRDDQDRLGRMGTRGRAAVETTYSRRECTRKFEATLCSLAG